MRALLLSAAAGAALIGAAAPALAQASGQAAAPRGYKCADENGVCAFEGAGTIYYGAGGVWFVQSHTLSGNSGVVCGNGQFGDPTPGVYKACYVELAGGPVVQTPGGDYCAGEGDWCGFEGEGTVYYGAYDRWYVRTLYGGAWCNNDQFGDPMVGYSKACYVVAATPAPPPPPPPPPADWRPEAQAAEGCWMRQEGDGLPEEWVLLEATDAGVEVHDVYLDSGDSREPGRGWVLSYSTRYEPGFAEPGGHASFGNSEQAFWFSEWNRAFSQDSRKFLRYYKFPLDASITRQTFTRWTSCGDGCQQPYTYEAPTPTWEDCNNLLNWAKEYE